MSRRRFAGLHALLLLPLARLDAQVVLDVLDAPATIDHVLDGVFHLPFGNRTLQRYPAVLHFDADVADVGLLLLGQALANELADALIRTGVVLRSPAGARNVGLLPAGQISAGELAGLAERLMRLLAVPLHGDSLLGLLTPSLLANTLGLLAPSLLAESLLGLPGM